MNKYIIIISFVVLSTNKTPASIILNFLSQSKIVQIEIWKNNKKCKYPEITMTFCQLNKTIKINKMGQFELTHDLVQYGDIIFHIDKVDLKFSNINFDMNGVGTKWIIKLENLDKLTYNYSFIPGNGAIITATKIGKPPKLKCK
jgi:hypothetical protein